MTCFASNSPKCRDILFTIMNDIKEQRMLTFLKLEQEHVCQFGLKEESNNKNSCNMSSIYVHIVTEYAETQNNVCYFFFIVLLKANAAVDVDAAVNDWPWVPLEEESGCSSVDSHSRCYCRSLSDLLEWCGLLVLTQTHASGLHWPGRGNAQKWKQPIKPELCGCVWQVFYFTGW